MTIDEFTKRLDEIAKEPAGVQLLLLTDLVKGLLVERFGGETLSPALELEMADFLRPFYAAYVAHPTMARPFPAEFSERLQ